MRRLFLLLLLIAPVWAQSPSPSPDEDRHWTVHGQEHEHNAEIEAGGEYTAPNLDAKSDNYPAIYKFMVRESNSEPFRRHEEYRLVLRDAAIVWGVNIAIILFFYRRRR